MDLQVQGQLDLQCKFLDGQKPCQGKAKNQRIKNLTQFPICKPILPTIFLQLSTYEVDSISESHKWYFSMMRPGISVLV